MELQARWACAVMAGAVPPPTVADLAAGVDRSRRIRLARPRPQFPHNDLEQADHIGRILGLLPGDDAAREAGGWYWNTPVVPAHYRMLGPHAKPGVARAQIDEAAARCREREEGPRT